MQRILHIIGKMDRAGAETMLMNLYRNIERDKFQFDFVVFTEEKGDYDDEIIRLGGRIIPILANNPLGRTKQLLKFLKAHPNYKVVHTHTLFSNAFHILAAKLAKVPVRISHSHNTDDQSKGFVLSNIYKSLSKLIINTFSTDKLACGKEAGVCLFGENEKDVLILPNAIDSQDFIKIAKENHNYINENFGVGESTLKIVQIGRFQEVKNHAFSVRVAKILKDKGADFKMFFVGKGDLWEDVQRQISDSELEGQIILTGLRTDIPQIMAGADIMIMPSLFEGFPVVLVESQAVGLQTIVSDQVTSEVDLNLDLVKFIKLDENLWAENILNYKILNKNFKEIESIFLNEGFDIFSSLQKVKKIYSKI